MNPNAACLVIDGFTEHISAINNPWQLAAALTAAGFKFVTPRECLQNNDSNAAKPADLIEKQVGSGYSFGGSTQYLISNNGADLQYDVFLLVLAVPDGMRGQFGNWVKPPNVKRIFCFQLGPDQSFPVSEPVKDAPWVEIDDPNVWAAIMAVPDGGALNISCKSIAKKVPWWEWLLGGMVSKVWNHTNIQNHPAVIDLCVRIAQQFGGTSGANTVTSP